MKKIISLFIAACLCICTLCIPAAANEGYLDAYNKIVALTDFFEKNERTVVNTESMGLTTNSWISFKVDFGTVGARVLCMEYAIPDNYAGSPVTVHLDSVENASIMEMIMHTTGGWNTYKTVEFLLDTPIIGEHIVYLKSVKSGTANFKSMKFKSSHTEISGPEFTLKDVNGTETDIFADAKTLTADASVLSYAPSDANANLVMVPYNANFERLATIAIDTESNINNRDTAAALSIENALSGFDANTVFFAALVDDGFKPMAESAFYNAPAVSEPTRTSEDKIDYYIDGTSVTVYGTLTDDSEKVLVGIRDESVSLGEYASYEFIYETSVTDGKYEHTFTMDEDTPTGTYTAVYGTSNETNEIDFHYSRPLDIVDAFAEINVSSLPTEDDSILTEIDNELDEWKTTLGITEKLDYINGKPEKNWMYTQIHGYLPFADLNALNSAIDKTIFLHKINTTDDDVTTAEANKSLIGLSEDTYYKKYFANSDKILLAKKLNGLMTEEIPLTSTVRFNELFREALAVTMLSNQIAWGSVDTMLVDFKDVLNTEYVDKYTAFSDDNRKSVAEEFINKDFSSTDEVVSLLKASYDTVYDEIEDKKDDEEDDKKGGGGGGGGFSSSPSKGFTVEVPMIEKPEIVTPVPQEPEEVISFDDLTGFEWASEAILYLAEEKIINGKSDNMYSPADNISREEFVKILVLALGFIDDSAECSFSDVSGTAWYYPYIATAYKNGWVNGYEDGSFGIGESITREQMATMFYRAIVDTDGETEIVNSTISFVDYGQISGYAADAVMNLAKAEIMKGVGMGMFDPARNASRAEAAVLVYNYLINR